MARYTMDAVLSAENNASSEIASLSADLGLLSAQLDHIDGRTININTNFDSGATLTELAAVNTAVSALDGRDVDVKVDVDAAGAIAKAGTASAALTALSISAQVVGRGVAAAARAVPGLGGALSGLGNVAVTAGVQLAKLGPAGIAAGAALAGLAATAGVAVLAAIGAVAAAIGPLVAGLLIATTAAAGLAAGLALIGGPVVLLVQEIVKYNESLKEAETAQKAVATATEALRSAEERAADATRAVGDARRQAAKGVASAVEQYRDSLRRVKEAEQGVEDAARRVAEARRQAYEGVRSAVESYRTSLEQVDEAEEGVADARENLYDATRNLLGTQRDLNAALRDEPLNQAEATLDLADARDRLGDATRDYNQAVREYGSNSEEATDALRNLQRAELELERQERETSETRRKGSNELRGAREQYRAAYKERREAAEGVGSAEEALVEAVRDSEKVQRGIRAAQIEGARQIADAKRGEQKAQRDVERAVRDSEQVQRGIRRAQVEGARQIADAKRGEQRAQAAVASAVKDLAAATREARTATVGLTGPALMLNRAWNRLKSSAPAGLMRNAKREAALLATEVLNLAAGALPRLLVMSQRSSAAMRTGFRNVRNELGPNERNSLVGILNAIPGMLQTGTEAAGKFGGGVVNMLSQAAPYAQRFLNSIAGSAQAFLDWTRSEEGRRQIDRFLKAAAPVAAALGNFLKDVGGRLFELGIEHGPIAAKAIDGLTWAVNSFISALDAALILLDKVIRAIQWINNAGPGPRRDGGSGPGYRTRRGDYVGMAEGGDLPGVPLYRAAYGMTSHYVEDPTLMSLGNANVLYGEALSPGYREYAFADGGNTRFITEDPSHDSNSYNLWRELGERKGYIAAPDMERIAKAIQRSGKGTETRRRRRPEKPALIRVELDGKVMKEYVTNVVWENVESGASSAGEEWGL